MMQALLFLENPLSRKGYLFNVFVIEVVRILSMFSILEFLKADHHFVPLSYFLCIALYFFTTGMILMLTARYRKTVHAHPLLLLLMLVPALNYLAYLYFILWAKTKH